MRIGISRRPFGFEYELQLAKDDRLEAERRFAIVAAEKLRLVFDRWQVQLPHSFVGMHPDVHALAIWTVVHPFIGTTLELPFGVSAFLADRMESVFGVRLPRVDSTLNQRQAPASPRPCLMLSGGVDSLAVTQILPRSAALLFQDRIPHAQRGARWNVEQMIDLVHPRAVCDALQAAGYSVHRVREDHEYLFEPYPTWHSSMYVMTALYLADSLNLGPIDSGDVPDRKYLRSLVMNKEGSSLLSFLSLDGRDEGEKISSGGSALGWSGQSVLNCQGRLPTDMDYTWPALGLVGLERVGSASGLNEVSTARIVFGSPFRGIGASCYHPSETNYCMRCDKCFKKLLLDRIFADLEVDYGFIELFIAQQWVPRVLRGPYFEEFHHIWCYIFQKIRCGHPWVQHLQQQALRGPDLSLLERWYPGAAWHIPLMYRTEVEEAIGRLVGVMSAEEVEQFERLEFPPLLPLGQVRGPVQDKDGTRSEISGESCLDFPGKRAFEESLDAVMASNREILGGWKKKSVTCSVHRKEQIEIQFMRAGAAFVVEVSPIAVGSKYFLTTGNHGIRYLGAVSSKGREILLLVHLVKKVVERVEREGTVT